MLSSLMGQLCAEIGVLQVFVAGEFFRCGIKHDDAPPQTSEIFLDMGYCYGSPILPTTYDIPILGKVKAILLVRDPRDMLVSLYYSMRESHPTPGQAIKVLGGARALAHRSSLDDCALTWAGGYAKTMRDYHEKLARSPLTKVFRYEDVVYDKATWVADICDHFEWDVPAETQRAIAKSADVFPDQERPDQHVRQVHPGNCKKKLAPDTIARLDDMLGPEMALFGYHG